MANKKYADYSLDFKNEFQKQINIYDTAEFQKFVFQIKEVAEKTGSMDWKMQAEYCELSLVKMYRGYKKVNYSDEDVLRFMFNLLKKAQNVGVFHIELKVRYDIVRMYWYSIMNYELALEHCEVQNQRLQNITENDVPEITNYYLQIADIYYSFKDYSKAISYFEKILTHKNTSSSQWFKLGALNTMGLCYRYGFNDLDRSDSCFQIILQTKEYLNPLEESRRENWEGIAEGNIGRNMVLRGEYDKAIPLLKNSLKKMLKFSDYAYSSLPAINLAIVYMNKGNLKEAKRYIDSAMHYHNIEQREGHLSLVYETISKYYAATGNHKLCIAYMDSTLAENKRRQEQFNALQMMRVEQRKHLSEQKLKDEQLKTEKNKNIGYLRSLTIALAGLLLIGGILVRYLILYRKKKSAYHNLAVKSQEWAAVEVENKSEQILKDNQEDVNECFEEELQDINLNEIYFSVIDEIQQLMSKEKLYTDTSLSIELLAKKLNAKRHCVSAAINYCKKKTFNAFINEYRIKEAIQLMSKTDSKTVSIDQIAFNSGFSDRKNFHRVFKKTTGLSPTEFRKTVRPLSSDKKME